jgi:acetylornithine aminotransferase/acetylornithine/N-succinyldiaminopimelate aminotransferase
LIAEEHELPTYKKLPLSIERGEGVYVFDREGRRYLDLYGGHAVASTGHCHPKVVEAIARQARELLFYSSVVATNVRAEAARRLVEAAGDPYTRVFFVNSGAEANEAALRLARQVTGRACVVALEGSFHGRTLGAASVTGLGRYRPAVVNSEVRFIRPGDEKEAERAIDQDTAAVILEPIQSMAGVREPAPSFFWMVREKTHQSGALLIFDEVQTGAGRVGRYLYSGLHGVRADLVTLAKGIASGFPMGALLVTDEVARRVGQGDLGSTFGGGPLACAALTATLDVLGIEHVLENVTRTSAWLRERLARVEGVKEVRGRGLLLGLALESPAADVQKKLLERNILVGTSDDPAVLRLLPPLTLVENEAAPFLDVLPAVLACGS